MDPSDPPSLRRTTLARRDLLSPEHRRRLGVKVISRLKNVPEYAVCGLPLLYVSFRSEVSTHGLIRERLDQRLPVAVPRTDVPARRLLPYLIHDWDRDLIPGAYGILEPNTGTASPIRPEDIDIVVIPGSVFDRNCARYGYGGGYYDRFLAREAFRAMRIGLAFGTQVMGSVPVRPHDEKMDCIVTENECIRCER